jgi:transposase-like protein
MDGIPLREAADQLNMNVSILRRWWNQLQEKGYIPEIQVEGKRILLGDEDIQALKSLQCLYNCMNLEEACKWVVLRYKREFDNTKPKVLPGFNFSMEIEQMNTEIESIGSVLYWNGPEKAVSQLRNTWEKLYQKINNLEGGGVNENNRSVEENELR